MIGAVAVLTSLLVLCLVLILVLRSDIGDLKDELRAKDLEISKLSCELRCKCCWKHKK